MSTNSVIITTYNQAQYLDQCMDSVVLQTKVPDQVIICDDASTDITQAKLKPWLTYMSDKKISYRVSQNHTNVGVFQTLDYLFESGTVTGDYWSILEGDDYWYHDRLEKATAFLDANQDYIAVHSDTDYLFPDGNVENNHWAKNGRYDNHGNHFDSIPSGFIYTDLLRNNFIMTCSFTGRAEAFRYYKTKLFMQRKYLMGDYPWFLGMSRVHQIGYIDESLAVYRAGVGTSQDPNKRAAFVASTLQIQQDAMMGKL